MKSINNSLAVRRAYHTLRDQVPMIVVYRPTTKDFPGQWVARVHISLPQPAPTDCVITADSLCDLRSMFPPGAVRIERYESDDPAIEEVWL